MSPRTSEPPARPLSGIRVLDLTWMIAGPNCCRLLADQGAEVIKLESNRSIDPGRMAGPWRNGVNTAPDGAGGFTHFNRGKLGATLDLKHPLGRELFLRLAALSDVVVNNYSAGTLERLGLGYGELASVNPRIIVADLSGLGRRGPNASFVAFGMTLMAQIGAYELTGDPEGPPNMPGYTLADWAGATVGAFAIGAALHWRASSGLGQYLDLGQLQMSASLFGETQLEWLQNGTNRTRNGNAEEGTLVHDVFACRDEDTWCAVVIRSDDNLAALGRLLGCDAADMSPDRMSESVKRWTRQRTPEEAMVALQAAGFEAAAVQTSKTLIDSDRHLRERGYFESIPDSFGEQLEMESVPFRMSNADLTLQRPGPMYGGDNDYVFRELLGLNESEYLSLRTAGVIP